MELKAKKELESQGYMITQAKITKFGGNDFFGIIDLICLLPGKHIKWIQVKSNKTSNKTREELMAFQLSLPLDNKVELWIWIDRKGWKKQEFGTGKPPYMDCDIVEATKIE